VRGPNLFGSHIKGDKEPKGKSSNEKRKKMGKKKKNIKKKKERERERWVYFPAHAYVIIRL